jgi:uracil-DNA glycosylase family 4
MQITNCKSCPLYKTRHNIVTGKGIIPADILFIGEAPSLSDDLLGRAFTGTVGSLIDTMRKRAGIYEIPAFFTNCVLCRPPSLMQEGRTPTVDEILACSDNLSKIISAVNPKHIVLLGDIAYKTYHRIYKMAIKITHPNVLLKLGGERAPGFIDNIIKLQQGVWQ